MQELAARELLDPPLDEGADFVGVRRSWDEATVRIYCNTELQMQTLISNLDLPEESLQVFKGKRFQVAMSTFQQRAYVANARRVSPLYLPGRFIDGVTASIFSRPWKYLRHSWQPLGCMN